MNGLNHNALTCSAVPIPPWERSLQTVEAQPYFNVSQASLVLEGIVFDRNNNLLFVDVATGRVFKLTPEQQLSIVLKENSFGASGLAVHKDGRIFIASVGDMQRGSVRAIEPNGTREQMIVAPDTGFLVNDLVFDNQGGFYFTDSRGNSADPQGGVFYVSPNVGSIHAILPGLAVGNGIAIRCGKTVARTYLFGQRRRTSQFSYYNMSAHNVYYVKSPIEGIYATYRIHSSVSLLFT